MPFSLSGEIIATGVFILRMKKNDEGLENKSLAGMYLLLTVLMLLLSVVLCRVCKFASCIFLAIYGTNH